MMSAEMQRPRYNRGRCRSLNLAFCAYWLRLRYRAAPSASRARVPGSGTGLTPMQLCVLEEPALRGFAPRA